MTLRVQRIHQLEDIAGEIVEGFKGVFLMFADPVNDVAVSIWEPIASKQLKLDQMLSLKTAQERPTLKRFAKEYTAIIQDIIASETTISQLSEESDDISQVLKQHNETLTSEFKSSSENFDIIFNDIIQRESTGSSHLS